MTNGAEQTAWPARGSLALGVAALVGLVGGLGLWSATTELAGAIVLAGTIDVDGRQRAIAHPDGGVVAEVLFRDGDRVAAGQTLLVLDSTLLRTELAATEGEYFEVLSRLARLQAVTGDAETLTPSPELIRASRERPDVAAQLAGQRELFQAERDHLQERERQLDLQHRQIRHQLTGVRLREAAVGAQLELMQSEVRDYGDLLAQGLTQASRLSALRREEARLTGEVGHLSARAAELQTQSDSLKAEQTRLLAERREAALLEMRDLDARRLQLRERRTGLRAQLTATRVESPVSGVVHRSQLHIRGSVLRPAEPVLFVVPDEDRLVARARLDPIHADRVFVGQAAKLRFVSFDRRQAPVLEARITYLSPTTSDDQRGSASRYETTVTADTSALEKLLADIEVLPGMPVQITISTGSRTLLDHLLRPLSDFFTLATRE